MHDEPPETPPGHRAGRSRRGRPPKAPGERRDLLIPLRLSMVEVEALDRNRGDLSRLDYLRLIALRGRRPTLPVPQLNRVEWVRLYELQRVLERIAMESPPSASGTDIRDLLGALRQEVVRLRQALLGKP